MLLIYLMLISLHLIKLIEPKDWKCPEINQKPLIECSCDLPHTLRCNGDKEALKVINSILKNTPISLLDCTLQGLKFLPANLLRNVSLHGLVISSGEIVKVHELAFSESLTPIQALGLPNNQLMSVPDKAISKLSNLERLDLSRNRIKTISKFSFRGLENLQYLDMSENRLEEISSEAFQMKPKFHVLRLRGNRLNITQLWKIANAQNLQEFDISANVIIGPLVTNMLPKLNFLKELYMNHNLISSVQQYALSSCKSITILSLNHNQIDVIEDYAFANLNLLKKLDLSHNRIVTVSNSSLANLEQLEELDLSYNFLRVLNFDLVKYLRSIQTLLLDYNDISMVKEHVFDHNKYLQKFNLIDNPLNCDCSLIWFMKWLINQTELSNDDKSTIICTTPPHLENAALIELSESYLYCSQDHQDDYFSQRNETENIETYSDSYKMENSTIKNAEVKFKNFWSTQNDIYLQWQIVHSNRAYKCDALFIYSELNNSEQLIETKPLKCHSDNFENSNILNIEFKRNSSWHFQNLFRFCLALMLEDDSESNVFRGNLIFGCSNLIQLIANQEFVEIGNKNLLNIQTRLQNTEILSVFVNVSMVNKINTSTCSLNVTLFESSTNRLLSHQQNLLENCSSFLSKRFEFNLKPTIFTYSVCISLLQKDSNQTTIVTAQEKCVIIERKHESRWKLNPQTNTIFTASMSAICILLAISAIFWLRKKYLSLNNEMVISGLHIKSPNDENNDPRNDNDNSQFDTKHMRENQQFNGYVQLDTSPD